MRDANDPHWGRVAPSYHKDVFSVVGGTAVHEAIVGRLKAEAPFGDVLECGCGTGMYSAVLAPLAHRVTAADCAGPMLSAAAATLQGVGTVALEQASCEALPHRDEVFDAVVMINLIHLLARPAQALAEAHRVLKPGGRLILASYTACGMRRIEILQLGLRYLRAFGLPPRQMRRSFSPDDLRSLAETPGFTVDEAVLIRNRVNAVYLKATK